ncbi:sulfotransferase domain-containing protein [Nocardioides antri]|uniref:Sulfotransferase domain-containing protein n=1 Tax=Nocardioides antri TaxID=2607659 RepID=A0A5B1M6I4_9ACTN|nr:sulfotransferase domain-containing protein [Nocardioides antri]KAA1428421.1 sulfotransferase domain-containing protein [Nocardioides antri]
MTEREVPNSKAVLIACMPKSGSTFLSALLANMPGFRREHLVPSYYRREQELSEELIRKAFAATDTLRDAFRQGVVSAPTRPRGFVAQHHVKHNHETQSLVDAYGLVPVFLVRNIYDIVISLRDHVVKSAPYTAAAYVDEDMLGWPEERMHDFLVDLALPWYIHFYVSWWKAENRLLVTYEDLTRDPRQQVSRIARFGRLGWDEETFEATLAKVQGGDSTRKNVGQAGRGEVLTQDMRDRIQRYCSYYPDVDFEPIGVPSS